ncbi:GDYXXLXY domain-containing protein [Bordetella tumulicola]|uniref:GDYXXLXY domain-containing protein n=1 Tax=Bordetella tumulicola TaxID=1649133 RepID=UPI0039EE845E
MQVKVETKVGSELHAWRKFLARGTLWLGVWLLGFAVICGVAANWQDLSKTQRFAGAQALLAVCVVAAAWLGWRLRGAEGPRRYGPDALLALAGLLLGGLLALLGQTYQTGADTWELFAWWGILLLPWASVAMSQAVWLLWMVVVNIATMLYLQDGAFLWMMDQTGSAALVALLNLLFLAGWEWAGRRWRANTTLGPRVLVAWIVGVLVFEAFFETASLSGLGSVAGLLWVVVTLGLGYYYLRERRDLIILALLAAGVICMSLRVVGEWLLDLTGDFARHSWVMLPLAGLVVGEAVLAARWLRGLAEQPVDGRSPSGEGGSGSTSYAAASMPANSLQGGSTGDSSAQAGPGVRTASAVPVDPLAGATPADTRHDDASRGDGAQRRAGPAWYVQGLLGLSAWLATLLLLLFLVISEVITSEDGAQAVGLVLCVLAVVGLRITTGLFWRQCLTAMGFAGQILVLVALLLTDSGADTVGSGVWIYVLLLGTAVYVLAPEVLLRFLSAGVMAFALAGLIVQSLWSGPAHYEPLWQWIDRDGLDATIMWLPVAVTGAWAAAVALVVGQTRPVLLPLGWAFMLAVQFTVWKVGGTSLMQLPTLWRMHAIATLLIAAGALLPVACALAVLWPRRQLLTSGVLWGVPLGLLALALFWLPSPGVAFALAWLLLGFGLRDIRLTVVGCVSLLVYLVMYYYQLEIPLLDKALWLGGAALLLFALRALVYLVPRWMQTIDLPAATPRPPVTAALRWRTAVVLGGLVAGLAVVNYTIWQRETLLTLGRTVILELAPVDPRSLMQGDYMALNFAAGGSLRPPSFISDPLAEQADGYLVLRPDTNGVAQVVRTQTDVQPLTGEETALRYRIRGRDVRIVTNAYFFPEGQADRYAQARYGEVRVGEDGTGLLVRMLGPDRQPL